MKSFFVIWFFVPEVEIRYIPFGRSEVLMFMLYSPGIETDIPDICLTVLPVKSVTEMLMFSGDDVMMDRVVYPFIEGFGKILNPC